MFAHLIQSSISVLTCSAEQHNRLNSSLLAEISAMMEKNAWQCHRCGIALPGLMEVDHLKGHSLKSKDALAPICQVCHDRDHLLWAASRKRFIPIHAPDLSYEDISRLTWTLILHQNQEGVTINKSKLERDLIARLEDAKDALGHDNVEALFETILTLKKSDACDVEEIVAELDSDIKLAPALLFSKRPEIKTWSLSGFSNVDDSWRDAARPHIPAYLDILKAGQAHMKRL